MGSFIYFFQLQNFICFLISVSFPKAYGIRREWEGGGVRGLGPGGDSLLEGATCRGQLTLVQYVHLKKQFNPADAFF